MSPDMVLSRSLLRKEQENPIGAVRESLAFLLNLVLDPGSVVLEVTPEPLPALAAPEPKRVGVPRRRGLRP